MADCSVDQALLAPVGSVVPFKSLEMQRDQRLSIGRSTQPGSVSDDQKRRFLILIVRASVTRLVSILLVGEWLPMQRLVLVLQQFSVVVERAKTQTENDLLEVLRELSTALNGLQDGKSLLPPPNFQVNTFDTPVFWEGSPRHSGIYCSNVT